MARFICFVLLTTSVTRGEKTGSVQSKYAAQTPVLSVAVRDATRRGGVPTRKVQLRCSAFVGDAGVMSWRVHKHHVTFIARIDSHGYCFKASYGGNDIVLDMLDVTVIAITHDLTNGPHIVSNLTFYPTAEKMKTTAFISCSSEKITFFSNLSQTRNIVSWGELPKSAEQKTSENFIRGFTQGLLATLAAFVLLSLTLLSAVLCRKKASTRLNVDYTDDRERPADKSARQFASLGKKSPRRGRDKSCTDVRTTKDPARQHRGSVSSDPVGRRPSRDNESRAATGSGITRK